LWRKVTGAARGAAPDKAGEDKPGKKQGPV